MPSTVTLPADHPDHARVRILPPLVPLGVILGGVMLQRVWPIVGLPTGSLRYSVGGTIIAAALIGIGLAVHLFRRSGQNPHPHTPTPSIVGTGPYRRTRNPMYLSMVLLCIGFAILLANPWILLLTPFGVVMLHRFAILPEEAYLEQKFGDAYLQYKQKVRRWL